VFVRLVVPFASQHRSTLQRLKNPRISLESSQISACYKPHEFLRGSSLSYLLHPILTSRRLLGGGKCGMSRTSAWSQYTSSMPPSQMGPGHPACPASCHPQCPMAFLKSQQTPKLPVSHQPHPPINLYLLPRLPADSEQLQPWRESPTAECLGWRRHWLPCLHNPAPPERGCDPFPDSSLVARRGSPAPRYVGGAGELSGRCLGPPQLTPASDKDARPRCCIHAILH